MKRDGVGGCAIGHWCLALVRIWPPAVGDRAESPRDGWSTLALVVAAVVVAIVVAAPLAGTQGESGWLGQSALDLPAWPRLLITMSVLSIAVLAASTQWRRLPLRVVGSLDCSLSSGSCVGVGQDYAAGKSTVEASSQLAKVEKSMGALSPPAGSLAESPVAARRTALQDAKEAALEGLGEAIAGYGDDPPSFVVKAQLLSEALADPGAAGRTQSGARRVRPVLRVGRPLAKANEQVGNAVIAASAAVKSWEGYDSSLEQLSGAVGFELSPQHA